MPPKKNPPKTAAERARDYRARKAEEAKAAAAVAEQERDARDAAPTDEAVTAPAGEGDTSSAGSAAKPIVLRDSVQQSIEHMKWLKPTDHALRDMALMYASQIDALLENDPAATGKAASLGQLLTRILRELGGAPTVRLQHELRSLRLLAGMNSEDGDDDGDDEQRSKSTPEAGTAPVIPIRPPKRKRA